jgi:hypothetical protein
MCKLRESVIGNPRAGRIVGGRGEESASKVCSELIKMPSPQCPQLLGLACQ